MDNFALKESDTSCFYSNGTTKFLSVCRGNVMKAQHHIFVIGVYPCTRDLKRPDFTGPGQAHMASIFLPAWSEVKKKILVWAQLGLKEKLKFWSEPGLAQNQIQSLGPSPACQVLSEFKTSTHNKCIFLLMIHFSAIY